MDFVGILMDDRSLLLSYLLPWLVVVMMSLPAGNSDFETPLFPPETLQLTNEQRPMTMKDVMVHLLLD